MRMREREREREMIAGGRGRDVCERKIYGCRHEGKRDCVRERWLLTREEGES